MASSNFVDYVKIYFRSGNGGAGSVHLLHTRSNYKAGPDGGDGGRGGHIILVGNEQLWTLLHLKYRKHIYADSGQGGNSANKTGADGDDVLVEVPIGTIAKDAEAGEVLCEITKHGEKQILLKGGRGGLGNSQFKTATNQTPRYAQPGEEGIEGWKILELKVLADVGLVGFPNAGKSTLLSVVSAAKPKIADYPFTTLVPNLGIVSYRNEKSFIMADIPGIIEGASEGKGLGVRFLRHIERNSVLLFVVAADSDDVYKQYSVLLNELEQYNPELLDKRRILGISKCELIDNEIIDDIKKSLPQIPCVFFSSLTNYNIDKLKDIIWQQINS
jgi:GTP-binding protein